MIIDSSYFLTKNVFIPNAVAQPSIGSNTPTSILQLNAEIDFREDEFLLFTLGYAQKTELLNQFETDGTWKPTALQKWIDLVDGVVFDGKKWNGLRYTIGTKKVSMIANYVYFFYLKDDFSTYSTTGIQVAKSENAVIQTPNEKQSTAWNGFVNMYNGNCFGQLGYSFSRNWNGTMLQWSGSNNNNEVSLYEFMSANTDLYDISFFTRKNVINPYNL